MKRIFKIDSDSAKTHVAKVVSGLPIDALLVVTVDQETKRRSTGQNSLQWVAVLGDFSTQGIVDGKKFSPAVWHEYLKELFLPDYFTEGETLKNYAKWMEMPDGELKMIGSTTKLTTAGFSNYMEKCYAFGAEELGIKFTANPADYT